MRVARLLVGLYAFISASGCSYALMRPVPMDHEQMPWVDCTSSRLAPIVDVVGVAEGVGTALAVEVFDSYGLTGEGDGEVSGGGRAIQVLALGAAVAYTASAIYGFRSASACSEAKELAGHRQLEHPEPALSTCASDAQCKAGRVCRGGSCTWPGCRSDAECKAGRRCLDGSCAWPVAPQAPGAPPAPPATPAASPAQAP